MTDSDTARLCVHIIREHFGPITAKVASALLTRGRLRLSQIIRFTGLKARLVASSVIIMIQHNILWHVENPNEGEMLEIGWEEVLVRLRFGRYVSLAKEALGVEASEIISLILDHGKLRLPDVLASLAESEHKKAKLYTSTFVTLLQSHYLKPTSPLSHISPRDRLLRYEADAKKGRRGFLTAKDIREIKADAEDRLKRENEEEEESGMKRKSVDSVSARSGKRQKVDVDAIDDDVYFRLNYQKFDVHLRNEIIETTVSQRFNDFAMLVMQATLKSTLHNQLTLKEKQSDPISISHIIPHLPPAVKLTGISPQPSSTGQSSLMKEYISILCAADNPTSLGRAGSFMSMQGGGTGGNGSTRVRVDFDVIQRRLRLRVLEGVIREKWGDGGVKIVRILLDKGKMDEKHLAKVAMMPKNDVQPLLTAMSSASLISLQEVPRGTDRAASRTFYLWYIDLPKTYTVLLASFYKTLANILARKESERERVEHLLNRSAEALGRMEREALVEWDDKKTRLGGLERRVEECVFVLRDLGGGWDRSGEGT